MAQRGRAELVSRNTEELGRVAEAEGEEDWHLS